MSQLVYGTDPEKFAAYKKDGELFVLPAAYFRKFLGVKAKDPESKHPIFIDKMDELGVIVMEDGVAFEYTITPDTNWMELFNRINVADSLLESYILSNFPEDCLPKVQTVPTISYDVERWQQYKKIAEFMMSMIFGCDRDYDAFNYEVKQPVVNALKHNKRYGGGHVHVSGSAMIKEEPVLAIQCMALSAGLASVAFSSTPELDRERTYLYGKPGKFRPQRYKSTFNGIPNTDFGVEYRTPSNSWTSSFEHASQIFKWVEIGIKNLLEQKLGLELLPSLSQELQDTLVNCNQEKAKEMLSFVESRI